MCEKCADIVAQVRAKVLAEERAKKEKDKWEKRTVAMLEIIRKKHEVKE